MNSKTSTANITDAEELILDSVQNGYTYMSEILDVRGPQIVDQGDRFGDKKDPDVPEYLRAVDSLIRRGYLRRKSHRTTKQLYLELTDQGQEHAPPLSTVEREVVAEYGVSLGALSVLAAVIDYQEKQGSLPTPNEIVDRVNVAEVTYQASAMFQMLSREGLAEERGFLKFRIEPNDRGRSAIEHYREYFENQEGFDDGTSTSQS